MNFLKKIFPFYNQYSLFAKAKLQSSYIEYLKFRLGFINRTWPAHKNCTISNADNIYVGINSLIGRSGNYIQGAGGIEIGNYTRVAVNCGILSSNHDLYDHNITHNAPVKIGDYCWIGMNSVVLPGVTLGTRTIVAAGSVVTKSFPDGFCVIGGSPAKIIKELDPSKFIPWKDKEEFYGFIPKNEYEKTEKFKKLRNKINSI